MVAAAARDGEAGPLPELEAVGAPRPLPPSLLLLRADNQERKMPSAALALLRRAAASTAAAPALFPCSALALSHAKRRREEREGDDRWS